MSAPGAEACVLIDGGTGTELRRRGVRLDPIAWSGPAALAHFGTLVDIHADYIEAGADVITVNTFATTRFVLDAAGFGRDFDAINRASVAAAQRACDRCARSVAIAGSISCLPPGFDVAGYPAPDAERAAYRELAGLLAELGVDLLVLEMMEETVHARWACEAVREIGLPFWLGVSARRRDDGSLVAYDFPEVPFDDVLDALLGYAPEIVNVMHTPAADVAPALAAVRARWPAAVGAYPEIANDQGGARVDLPTGVGAAEPPTGQASSIGPAELAARAEDWLGAGARVLGGCCGTEPGHVRALRTMLARHSISGFQP